VHRIVPWAVVLLSVAALSCAPGRRGGGDDGGGGGDSTTPRGVCDRYLTCLAAAEPTDLTVGQELYGDNGSCWEAGSEFWDACGAACEELQSELLLDHAGIEACWIPWYEGDPPDLGPGSAEVGEVAPNLVGLDQFDQPIELRQFYGLPVLVVVTAGWLPIEVEPWVWDFADETGGETVAVFISGEEPGVPATAEEMRDWADQWGHDLSHPFLAPEGNALQEDWGIESIPTFVVIDSEWVVRELHVGGDIGLDEILEALE